MNNEEKKNKTVMRFNKEIFKERYGKIYLDRIRNLLVLNVISIVLLALIYITKIKVPIILGLFLVDIPAFTIFPILLLLWSFYRNALKVSERQKQWFEDGQLHVLMVPIAGFDGGGMSYRTKEYIVHSVSSIAVSLGYIEIIGEISLTDINNGHEKNKEVTKVKIPRNFTNEEIILTYYPQI